jgi:uncharacterized protein (DUF2147 family)
MFRTQTLAALTPALLAASWGSAQAAATGLAGRWLTPAGDSIVEFRACTDAPGRASLCGRLADLAAHDRRDTHNPAAALRDRRIEGLEIIRKVDETGAGAWSVGELYNPDDGRTYSGSLRLRPDGKLELKGCALRIFCRSESWTRAAP